jgi:hypothetical protein
MCAATKGQIAHESTLIILNTYAIVVLMTAPPHCDQEPIGGAKLFISAMLTLSEDAFWGAITLRSRVMLALLTRARLRQHLYSVRRICDVAYGATAVSW